MTRALLALVLAACCHELAMPPPSLACKLTRPPPPWYEVEAASLPDCLVVAGVVVPTGACCPPETACLTARGGRALLVDKPAHTSWEAEAWARCRP